MEPVDVAANLARVRARIAAAAQRAGRDARRVTLIAVAKTKPAAMIDAAIAAGATCIGENYVQEARAVKPLVAGRAAWHLIGHLQRNKARLALTLFDVIQTLDSTALASALDRLGAERGAPVPALVEVNLGGEASKRGVAPEKLAGFVEELAALAHVRVEGLMAIPPPAGDESEARAHFRRLRQLRDQLGLRELSMGMTDDFEIAVEEGATIVRVGRAIFGART